MRALRQLMDRVGPLSRDLGIGSGIFAAVTLAIAFDRATPAISVFDALGFGAGHPGRWLLLALAAAVFAAIFAVNMHFARLLLTSWRSARAGTGSVGSLHEHRAVSAKSARGMAYAPRR